MVALVLALSAGAIAVPTTDPPEAGPAVTGNPPPVAVCAVEEGRGRTSQIQLLSAGADAGQVTGFAAGEASGSLTFGFEDAEPGSFVASDLSVVGVAAALVESGEPSTSSSVSVLGPDSVSAESCLGEPASQSMLGGGSTLSGEEFEVQLMNPYAGQARVEITAVSESGVETNQALDDVVVQPRTSAVIDLADLLPGRERLSIVIEVVQGNVLAVGRFFNGTDSAVWNAKAPREDSYVLVPASVGERLLTIASPTAVDVTYQVDVYGPDGLVEAYATGVLAGNGTQSVDLSDLGNGAVAARVLATAPVGAFVRIDDSGAVAVTSSADGPATRWLMPGAGSISEASTSLTLFNPGSEDATVLVEGHIGLSPASVQVPADSSITYDFNIVARPAVTVVSDLPIIALWVTSRPLGKAISLGVPIADE